MDCNGTRMGRAFRRTNRNIRNRNGVKVLLEWIYNVAVAVMDLPTEQDEL